jgi:hypothetical protein
MKKKTALTTNKQERLQQNFDWQKIPFARKEMAHSNENLDQLWSEKF